MASIYSYDQDEIWQQATKAARLAVADAESLIVTRCEELGIPARFAPGISLNWHGRGENEIKRRRDELRKVAQTRIEALEADALTKIKMFCHDAHARVLAHGLTSASAIEFFDSLPSAEQLMPSLEVPSIEKILQTRINGRESQRQSFYESLPSYRHSEVE